MNKLIKLQGNLNHSDNEQRGGKKSFYKNSSVSYEEINNLIHKLEKLKNYWLNNRNYITNCLITVVYKSIVSKSRRIEELLKYNHIQKIIGARFETTNFGKVHAITYLTTLNDIDNSIECLKMCLKLCSSFNDKLITSSDYKDMQEKNYHLENKTKIIKCLKDINNIDEFKLPNFIEHNKLGNVNIVTFFNTGIKVIDLLTKLNIDNYISVNNNDVYMLSDTEMLKIKEKAPYLVSMAVKDITSIDFINDYNSSIDYNNRTIKKPSNEPIIGVIDSLFDEKVYFNEWVDYHCMVDSNIPYSDSIESKLHGTEVDSIIVDGPRLNKKLDDNCGYFRVRHFGIVSQYNSSRLEIMRKIKEIIEDHRNRDIHVWNLSLGSKFEIEENFISPEAALLDELQNKYPNIIFVVSGTNDENKGKGEKGRIKIGAPADSLNSIVVNSVRMNNQIASYTRKGEVLGFFCKPDISYYGGDSGEELLANNGYNDILVKGTSFSAPWISRKMAYLIDVMGMTREVAKALLIDSSAKWEPNKRIDEQVLIGYGIVPVDIKQIIYCADNEIRFFISDYASSYNNDTLNIPIPVSKDNTTSYYARAVLCYSPCCSRNEGIDYTNTELSLSFGRVSEKINSKGNKIQSINTINNNVQEEIGNYMDEEEARKVFRKWDNTKRVVEKISLSKGKRDAYSGYWGFKITNKDRSNVFTDRGIPFGIVVTFFERNFENRQREFINNCYKNGCWLPIEIDIENRNNIYNVAQEEIEFE